MGQFLVRFSLWYTFGFTNNLPYVLFLRYVATKRNDETIFLCKFNWFNRSGQPIQNFNALILGLIFFKKIRLNFFSKNSLSIYRKTPYLRILIKLIYPVYLCVLCNQANNAYLSKPWSSHRRLLVSEWWLLAYGPTGLLLMSSFGY